LKKHWVIPDIHGYSKTLRALIEEQIRPGRPDILYFLGDYIDRGPDSRGVIDCIMGLQEDGYSIRPLKGNHEDFLLRLYDGEKDQARFLGIPLRNRLRDSWFMFGGRETLASFGLKDVCDIPERYIEWLRQLEYYIELEEHYLVHAGFNFSSGNPFSDTHSMLWIREFEADPVFTGGKRIVHGHVPVSLEFIDMVRRNPRYDFLDLDNGVYMPLREGFGNLVAYELLSGELVVQPNVG
jgi:serine/threonine protein phosphatase 1